MLVNKRATIDKRTEGASDHIPYAPPLELPSDLGLTDRTSRRRHLKSPNWHARNWGDLDVKHFRSELELVGTS